MLALVKNVGADYNCRQFYRQYYRQYLEMSMRPRKISAAAPNAVDRAYQILRERAIAFRFRPGERVNELELSRELEMSRAPIREALNRLVTDGLLSVEPNRGFSCRKLSASEISGLYAVRADIEAGGILETISRKDRKGFEALKHFWRNVTTQMQTATVETLVQRDEEFHLRLAALSQNAERVRLLSHINARIRFVRRINLEPPDRRAQSLGEHADLLDRVAHRDGAGASTVLRKHLQLSAEEALESIKRGLAVIYADSVA